MYRRVMAFDFDGTLAENGKIPLPLRSALKQLHQDGFALFLVTGRQYKTIPLGRWSEVFSGIAWENGAVLTLQDIEELYLPFGHIDARLVEKLEEANIPLEYGVAIVATQSRHEETIWRILSETGGDAALVHNKGALMLLPPGASKRTGLARLLELCGFSARNLISFGDGENDLALFQLSETGVAVADAVPSLQAVADYVTEQPGPAGVLETLETFWLKNERSPAELKQREHLILLGKDDSGEPVHVEGTHLITENMGVFGDSGSGKSWVTGLLAEGMHLAGYQVLLIDPEGDYRGLHSLPGIVSLSSDQGDLPAPRFVVTLLTEASISVVLDLCHYPAARRVAYVTELFEALRPLKENKFRPHWIVLEEAQDFLPPHGNPLHDAILPLLSSGGWVFISYRPDRLAESVMARIDHCLVARLSQPEAVQSVRQIDIISDDVALEQIPVGYIVWRGSRFVRLRSAGRHVPHIRHLYKYLDMPLPRPKRFHFHTREKYLGLEVANLFEFKEIIPQLPLESLEYHLQRGDFAAWVRNTLDDEILAADLEKLASQTSLEGEALRQALQECVASRYEEIRSI